MPIAAGTDARDVEHLLTLNLTEGIGVVLYRRLVRHFGSLDAVAKASEKSLREVAGIGPVLAKSIREHVRQGTAAREIELAARLGLRILPFWHDDFPAVLKPLYDPPLVLYQKGALAPDDVFAVAIVGTRTPTYYGRSQAERFARLLAARRVTVVSGLARGVDTAAHEAALKAGGRTVAVLGSGLRNVYPPENAKLAERIAERGALLSEFALAASPNPKNFPRRNRIVSGLSLGVLVVEAGAKSGALIR
jgi:DNA processing protein